MSKKDIKVIIVTILTVLGAQYGYDATAITPKQQAYCDAYRKNYESQKVSYVRFKKVMYGEEAGQGWLWKLLVVNAPDMATELAQLDMRLIEIDKAYQDIEHDDIDALFVHNQKTMTAMTDGMDSMSRALHYTHTLKMGDLKGTMGDY